MNPVDKCSSATRPAWRAACLRGIAEDPDGLHALVALSAEQYLRLPLGRQDVTLWQARIGRRVWVDFQARPMRLGQDADAGVRHE